MPEKLGVKGEIYISCLACGGDAVALFGTATNWGAKVLIKAKCLATGCGKVEELPVTQVMMYEFDSMKGGE